MPVAARFHQIRDRVVAAVDCRFAEPVRLSPMAGGRSDPQRSQIEIEAVLRVGEGKQTSASGSASQSWRSRLEAGKAELHIDRTRYPDFVARAADRVRALSRPGQPVWEVLGFDDRSHTRLVLQLGEA